MAARLYAERVTRFLDWIDLFFGDAGMAGQRAFGLRTPAPLWTAPAFDRCLLLALFYPIFTIFLIWAVSGDVGPAEAALGLEQNIAGYQRGLEVAGAVLLTFAGWKFWSVKRWKSWVYVAIALAFNIVIDLIFVDPLGDLAYRSLLVPSIILQMFIYSIVSLSG